MTKKNQYTVQTQAAVAYFRQYLKPGVGNHPVITYAYLSQVDKIA